MIRFLAVVMMIGGIGAGFVWPALVLRHSGEELTRATVFDRADGGPQRGWRSAEIRLDPRHNPLRLLLEAEFLPGTKSAASTVELQVTLASEGSIILEGVFDMALPQSGGASGQISRSDVATPDFAVDTAGPYTVTVRPVETLDLNFSKVSAAIRSGVDVPDNRWREPAIAAIGLGVVLLLFSGRGSKAPSGPPPQERARPPQKPRRWGRN